MDHRLADLPRHANDRISKILESAVVRRRAIYLAGSLIVMAAFAALQTRSAEPHYAVPAVTAKIP